MTQHNRSGYVHDSELGRRADWGVREALLRGEIVAVGHKLYGYCQKGEHIVRLNKPLIGSLHICDPRSDG